MQLKIHGMFTGKIHSVLQDLELQNVNLIPNVHKIHQLHLPMASTSRVCIIRSSYQRYSSVDNILTICTRLNHTYWHWNVLIYQIDEGIFDSTVILVLQKKLAQPRAKARVVVQQLHNLLQHFCTMIMHGIYYRAFYRE